MPYLELLWNQYQKANINMGVFNLDEILVVDRIDSLNLPRTYFTPGKALPFHCTGLGKMLTAEMDESQLDALIAKKGLKSFTSKTLTDPSELKEELNRVRLDQVARDRNEYILKDNCNAAPIRDRTGRVIAAISLSAFENYMSVQEIEDTIPAVQETARKISYMAGYHDGLI
jgi:DNA-binding IclR family transcriptional regulator